MENLDKQSMVERSRVINMTKAERFDYYHEMAKKVVDQLEDSHFALIRQERNTFLDLLKLEFIHRFGGTETTTDEAANMMLQLTKELKRRFF